ncbi:AAA family ATPase [Cylindrospermum sp. FACHB-282]|uniref:AAA family ATPase n=1 Tax=Cylindrospermum sp. FACHB-282 TaxID=2692794 RepID=UPI0016837456|nr:AAA family ATPase [Cylindrospermum sp. FACHB-282]MBD2384358.1 AAA family ATPase [Cylindrospermum sp. FACHB-282]
MRVKQLKMQSFRGIADLTLDFDEKEPTVFVGINGVGKSSILDCIAILLSNILKEIVYPTLDSNLNSFSFIFSSPKSLKLGKVDEYEKATPGQPEIKERFFSETDITNGYKETSNHISISIDSEKLAFCSSSSKEVSDYNNKIVKFFQKIHHQSKQNHSLNIPLGVFYSVSRAVIDIDLRIIDISLLKQIDAYDEALNGIKISFHRFFQWFRSVEDLENEMLRDNRDYYNPQLEAVKQAISSLIPEFSNLRVRRSPNLRMTVQKQGEELIINQLSDGEKCLLAMVGDLARRLAIANPGLEEPLQGAGVVLIDEIELHLHPKWQREIIPALTRTFPNCQFIVTTHSPQVISEVKPEGIYILEKTDTGVVANRPESSYGRDSNQILEDLMGVPKRPLEIKDSLHDLFKLIEEGNLDGARQLSQQIADIIGESEPELVKARVSIRRKEILKR